LDDGDRRVLSAIIDKFDGGPVGIETLAAATSEEADAIMDVYEPYLLQLGFLIRTPRGRVATARAYEHLSKKPTSRARERLGLFLDAPVPTSPRQGSLWENLPEGQDET
jgi:Holliday junction DNA helicase RuvB